MAPKPLIPPGLLRRLRMRNGEAGNPEDAEFPELSRPVNETLYRVGKGSMALRRLWPAGTSLFAVLTRSA